MEPGVQCHGIKINPPGYPWSKFEGFLTSGVPRYELMKNLHIKGDRRGMGMGMRTTVVTIIALCTSCSGGKKAKQKSEMKSKKTKVDLMEKLKV